MKQTLNMLAVREAMQEHGLNQAKISSEIDVSRAAVTKWFSGEDFPRPDKLLKLGALLELGFKQLVSELAAPSDPVIAFRRKGGRQTTEAHIERAKHMGALLHSLAPLLPFDTLARPATLRNPVNEYDYLQRVARRIRDDIGIAPDAPVQFRDLIGRFTALNTVIIPVLWGHKDHHENALHIYLPESMTTWVYLNLDSNIHDFKFWMAHELGHVHSPELREEEAEDFADSLAQALLFTDDCAAAVYDRLSRAKNEGARINRIKDIAREYGISPTTVNLAMHAYARAHGKAPVDVGPAIHAASKNFNKDFPSVGQTLFPQVPPSPKEYVAAAGEIFKSPFFDVLQQHIRQANVSVGFVETILQLPLLDAKAIIEELR